MNPRSSKSAVTVQALTFCVVVAACGGQTEDDGATGGNGSGVAAMGGNSSAAGGSSGTGGRAPETGGTGQVSCENGLAAELGEEIEKLDGYVGLRALCEACPEAARFCIETRRCWVADCFPGEGCVCPEFAACTEALYPGTVVGGANCGQSTGMGGSE